MTRYPSFAPFEPDYTPSDKLVLGMIVRDEVMNPGGGLLPMLQYHAPHFSEIHVADTGSVDMTRELLEDLQSDYPQLHVHDFEFRGFADARNTLLEKIRETPHEQKTYVLSLDADEYLAHPSKLHKAVKPKRFTVSKSGFRIPVFDAEFDGRFHESIYCWNNRCYALQGTSFYDHDGHGENIARNMRFAQAPNGTFIAHMKPSPDGSDAKYSEWYGQFERVGDHKESLKPNECQHFRAWKLPNPKALAKFDIDLEAVFAEYEARGITVDERMLQEL